MLFDNHSHTSAFSPDASQTPDELLAEALSQGLAGLMITEHLDKDVADGRAHPGLSPYGAEPAAGEWSFVIPDYFAMIETKRRALLDEGSDFKLLRGIEVGYLPYQMPQIRDYLARFDFDGIIGSIHCMDNLDIYDHRDAFGDQRQDVEALYLDYIQQMLTSGLDFDIVGHYDYIVRYLPGSFEHLQYRTHQDQFDTIFRLMIDQGKSLEINTASRSRSLSRDGIDIGFQDDDIILRYLELGGQLISLSSDSHGAGSVAQGFSETADWLRSLGVRALTHFEARQPVLISI